MGKACSPRFLSAVTVTVRSIGRREGKEKKKEEEKEKESTRETQPKLFQSWLVQVLCGENRDQRLLVNRRSRYRFNLYSVVCSLYVKRFRLTIGRFQGRLVCINWSISVFPLEFPRLTRWKKKHRSSQKLADFSFIPMEEIWWFQLW